MRRSKLRRLSSVLTTVLAGASAAALAPSPAHATPASHSPPPASAGPTMTPPPASAGRTAAAAMVTLPASDDTYASTGHRNATFGGDDKLVIGTAGRDVKTSYLKFSVPPGRFTGARLALTAAGSLRGTVTLHRVADTRWRENALNSANAPTLGAVVGRLTPPPGGASLTFDLGGVVDRPGTYSFALTSNGRAVLLSGEARSGGPVLTLTPGGPAPAAAGTPCTTGRLLVPSCGVLWGAAAGGFTGGPRDEELLNWERLSGRTATIFHAYHKGDEIFPTRSEIAMTRDPAHPRVLLLNWKVAYGTTWAAVAEGDEDDRIDAFAERAKAYGQMFFLALNHEPENDVVDDPDSGMQASDFAAMYRHTILRLRADGVTNVVNVLAYMGNEHWMAQDWWRDLYPGDDVVDWIGLDSYVNVEPGYHHGLFGALLDRGPADGQGFYDWATTRHPGKPIMVAEWGAYHPVGRPADKSAVYDSVLPELAHRPAIKALVYFDTKHDATGDRDISIDSTRWSLAAFRRLAASPLFDVKIGRPVN